MDCGALFKANCTVRVHYAQVTRRVRPTLAHDTHILLDPSVLSVLSLSFLLLLGIYALVVAWKWFRQKRTNAQNDFSNTRYVAIR